MAAITDLSDLINRMTGGNNGAPETVFFHKLARSAGSAAPSTISGRATSLWRYDGMPSAGAEPTSAEITDKNTVGAIPFTAPGGSREKFLISAGIAASGTGVFLLYDRLFHIGGLSGAVTTDQTVQGSTPSPALTRYTSGVGNFVFYEIYTAIGTSSTNVTMTYTNQNGVSGKTATMNIGGSSFRENLRAQRINLDTGDTGVQAVEKIKLNASTGTAGNFGITIGQPLAWIAVGTSGVGGWRDYTTGLPSIPAINPNACLSLLHIASTTTAVELMGSLSFVEK